MIACYRFLTLPAAECSCWKRGAVLGRIWSFFPCLLELLCPFAVPSLPVCWGWPRCARQQHHPARVLPRWLVLPRKGRGTSRAACTQQSCSPQMAPRVPERLTQLSRATAGALPAARVSWGPRGWLCGQPALPRVTGAPLLPFATVPRDSPPGMVQVSLLGPL